MSSCGAATSGTCGWLVDEQRLEPKDMQTSADLVSVFGREEKASQGRASDKMGSMWVCMCVRVRVRARACERGHGEA